MLQVRIINAIWTHKYQHLYSQPSGIKHFCKWKLVNKCIFRIVPPICLHSHERRWCWFLKRNRIQIVFLFYKTKMLTHIRFGLWSLSETRFCNWSQRSILWGIYFRNENPANTHFYAINFPHFWPTNIILKSIKFSSWHLCRGLSRTLIFSYSLQ